MKKFIILLLIFFSFYSCNKDNWKLDNSDAGTIHNLNLNSNENLSYNYQSDSIIHTELIDDVFIIEFSQKKNGSLACYINEIYKDKLLKYYMLIDDMLLYNKWVNYDSLEYDKNSLKKADLSHRRVDSMLSSKFYNISELRKNDTSYQNGLKKANDIDEIQRLINLSPFFSDFDTNNAYKMNVLKQLLILLQMETSCYMPVYSDFHDFEYATYRFRVREINDSSSFDSFKFDVQKKNEHSSIIYYNWSLKNKNYLITILPVIASDYKNENVIYFYSNYDLQLMKFVVKHYFGKTYLTKEFLNPEQTWIQASNQIYRNPCLAEKYFNLTDNHFWLLPSSTK